MIQLVFAVPLSHKALCLQNALPHNILDEAMEALNDSKDSPKPSPTKEHGEAGGGIAPKEGETHFFSVKLVRTFRERQSNRYDV